MGINEKIKEYIESHGITQSFLCEKTGLSADKMSNIINGKRKISGEELIAIAKALELNVEFFSA